MNQPFEQKPSPASTSFRGRRLLALALVLAAVAVGAGVFLGRVLLSSTPHLTRTPQWQVISSPSLSSLTQDGLVGVTAISANDVWAVGMTANSGSTSPIVQTLIEHWNGRQWSVTQSPNTGSMSNVLSGIAAVGANDIWAVGLSSDTPIRLSEQSH